MKLLEINSCSGCLSTGRIAADIAKDFLSENENNQAVIAYARDFKDCGIDAYKIGNRCEVYLHKVLSMLDDADGLGSVLSTKRFLGWANSYNPDILWLHNIHGYYINYELLFQWIKTRPYMKVYWTMHDCWAFTGHCSYFSVINCEKWKEKCNNCPQYNYYPKSFVDRSQRNYDRKRESFTGVRNLTIVVPSNWLASIVKQSFLKEYPITVRYNKVNKSVFYPRKSNFRDKYKVGDKIIILGVASTWSSRKGLNEFVELSKRLGENFKIVLVGVTDKQSFDLPDAILPIKKTTNADELAEIYSAADFFVNPSKEETFGLTTVEALYCGTKAIVYKGTACEEIAMQYGGIAVEQNVDSIIECINKELMINK